MHVYPPIRYLVLFVTGACNLHCRYCYAADIPALPLSLSIALRALDLAAASNEPFHVQLTGGEPTLMPETIAGIASLIRDRKLMATIGLQTNGTLLDDALIDLLVRYQIEVGISLDGVATVHDAERGGFNETLRGLKRLMKRNIPCRVTTVVTAESALHLDKLVLLLAGFPNVRGVGLDLLTLRGAAIKNSVAPVSEERLETAMEKVRRAMAFVNQNRAAPFTVRELDTAHPSGCHAALKTSLAVLPDGRLFPCSQTAGDPAFLLGVLGDGVLGDGSDILTCSLNKTRAC
jgi:uncharacterized protein